MDIQTILAFVFLAVMVILLYLNRKKLEVQKLLFPIFYFILYKTKLGIKYMDRLSKKFPRTISVLSWLGIVFGFIGMAIITFELVKSAFGLFTQPQAAAAVALVLPFQTGLSGIIAVPFFYWIISIFIIAVVHEFSHGVVARLHKLKINSSGFAFLSILIPVIPAAFVEPDEKQMSKKPAKVQLGVLAAGPFANILLALIVFLLITFFMAPLVNSMVNYDGVSVVTVSHKMNWSSDYPAAAAGMQEGAIIKSINGVQTPHISNFTDMMVSTKPGEVIAIMTQNDSYNITLVENPGNASRGFLGIAAEQHYSPKQGLNINYPWLFPVVGWFSGLFTWLFILNLGIGLFNLVPLGPIDGGRMLNIVLVKWLGEKKGGKLWGAISLFILAVLALLIIMAFVH